jgi:hypothetical protein
MAPRRSRAACRNFDHWPSATAGATLVDDTCSAARSHSTATPRGFRRTTLRAEVHPYAPGAAVNAVGAGGDRRSFQQRCRARLEAQTERNGHAGHFNFAGYTRDGEPDNTSGKPLTWENAWEADGLRSRVRRFESCRGHRKFRP